MKRKTNDPTTLLLHETMPRSIFSFLKCDILRFMLFCAEESEMEKKNLLGLSFPGVIASLFPSLTSQNTE